MQSQDDEVDYDLYVDYDVWLESLRSIHGNEEERRKFVERIVRQTGLLPEDVETTVRTLTQYLARNK
jgi:hypothetical protein